jgi:hypothetical protein
LLSRRFVPYTGSPRPGPRSTNGLRVDVTIFGKGTPHE